jgi:hypothetical protein
MLIECVDAFVYVKGAHLICELLDAFIRVNGLQYVVQVIMDNAANYVVTGRLLIERYQTLYYTSCATRCIHLMLKERDIVFWIKKIC